MTLRERLMAIVSAPIAPSYCETARDAIVELDKFEALVVVATGGHLTEAQIEALRQPPV